MAEAGDPRAAATCRCSRITQTQHTQPRCVSPPGSRLVLQPGLVANDPKHHNTDAGVGGLGGCGAVGSGVAVVEVGGVGGGK